MSRPISILKHYTKNFRHFNATINRPNCPSLATSLCGARWRSSPAGNPQVEKETLSNADAILSNVRGADVSQAVALLKALRVHTLFRGKDQASDFRDDARFQGLCLSFERGCQDLPPSQLVSGLRSLLEVGLPSNAPCVVAAERRLLDSVARLGISQLVGCLYYHHRFTHTPLQQKVVAELVSQIPRRARHLDSASDVLMLVHILHLFKDHGALEARIAELVPTMSARELHRLLVAMAERSVRNVPILKAAASSYLRQGKPGLKETLDLLYAFKKLNFYDPLVYGHLLDRWPQEIESVERASLISGLLTVCGHLRWRHKGILNACARWIRKNSDVCGSRALVSYILAAAALDCFTEETTPLLDQVMPQLEGGDAPGWPPSVLLDVAWSLAVLGSVPRALLLRVLSKEFYNTLVAESQSTYSNHLKLLNLKGVLRKEHPECVFGCDLYLEPTKLTENPTIVSCRQHVTRVLANFVPKDTCLCTHLVTDTGVFIDAEFIMNEYMKPLSLENYGILSEPDSTLKKLPPHAKRLCLLVLFHRDLTLSSRTLTGANVLGVRLLSQAGYTPVTILYDEFSENKTELQKAKYLMERIKTCAGTS